MTTRSVTRYQGEPCHKGHNGIRFHSNGGCVQCMADRQARLRAIGKQLFPNEKERHLKRMLIRHAIKRAQSKGQAFSIGPSDFTIPRVCPVLADTGELKGPTLYPFDPARGYVPGNIAVISARAYHMLSMGTDAELRMAADWRASGGT